MKFLANLDKKEIVRPQGIGLGGGTIEHTGFVGSLSDALYLLVTVRKDQKAPYLDVAGRWVGDRVMVLDREDKSMAERLEKLGVPASDLRSDEMEEWTDLTPMIRIAFSELYSIEYREVDMTDFSYQFRGDLRSSPIYHLLDYDKYLAEFEHFHRKVLPVRTSSGAISAVRLHKTRNFNLGPNEDPKSDVFEYPATRKLIIDHYFIKTDPSGPGGNQLFRLRPPLEPQVWSNGEWANSDELLADLSSNSSVFHRVAVFEAEKAFPSAFKRVVDRHEVELAELWDFIVRMEDATSEAAFRGRSKEQLIPEFLSKAKFAALEATLFWHSKNNFDSPLSPEVVGVWKKVIEWVNDGGNDMIQFELPEGLASDGETSASAYSIIAKNKLEPWRKGYNTYGWWRNRMIGLQDAKELVQKYLPGSDLDLLELTLNKSQDVYKAEREAFFASLEADASGQEAFVKTVRVLFNQPTNEDLLRDNPSIVDLAEQKIFLDSWRRSKGYQTDDEMYKRIKDRV